MLNLLGGGGNKGNQLIQTGGALNSLSGTLTPLFVGALIGTVTPKTNMTDVAPLLFIAMGVFAMSFLVISFVSIPEPHLQKKQDAGKKARAQYSPWSFRHFILGVIGIFIYVGIEVGIPGTLNFYLADASSKGAGILINGAAIGGAIAAIYWLLMLVGRLVSSVISGKVSSRVQLLVVSALAILLVIGAIFTPKSVGMDVPGFIYNPEEKTEAILQEAGVPAETIAAFMADPQGVDLSEYAPALKEEANLTPAELPGSMKSPRVPLSALLLILCGLCTSVMWGGIFNLAVEGLGKFTAQASGIFMMMVVGGGVLPLLQQFISDRAGYMASYWVIAVGLAYLLYYALIGSKNVNKDIPVE